MKKILTLALLSLTLLLVTSCGSKPEYDPMQYVTLKYKYFDGEGLAEPVVTPPETTDVQSSKVIELLKVTKFNYSPDRELSNGDIVTVVPAYDEEKAKKQGFKPIVEAVEFTVEGLPEGVEVDLWEWLNLIYGKKNGDGVVHVLTNNIADTNFSKDYVTFKSNKYSDLSNGDIITIDLIYNHEKALEFGYNVISEPTKQFTVSGLK